MILVIIPRYVYRIRQMVWLVYTAPPRHWRDFRGCWILSGLRDRQLAEQRRLNGGNDAS
ncbi:MAG: hypothetical protein ABGX16_05550 [Pirellulales bacterium]